MRSKILEVALGEIRAFSLVSSDVGEDSWKRLDSLYQQIETDLGRQPTPLARPDLRATAAAATPAAASGSPEAVPKAAGTSTAAAPPPAVKTASAPAPSGTSPFWLLLGFLALATVSAGGMWWGLGRQKTHRKTLPSFAADDDVALPSRPARPAGAPAAARPTRSSTPGTAPVRTEKPAPASVKATTPRPPRPKPKDQ